MENFMRRCVVLAVLTASAMAAVPSPGEAFGRRRAVRCHPPAVYHAVPACPPRAFWVPSAHPLALPGAALPVPGPTAEVAPAPAAVVIKGKTYRIIPHPDTGDERRDEPEAANNPTPPDAQAAPLPEAASAINPADRFTGTSRRTAKTTIFAGPVESFDTLAALLAALPPNGEMRNTIGNGAAVGRAAKERRNVRVRAYVYAFKKEPDRDYHVILGDAPGGADPRYLNAEISGIPAGGTDANRATLWAARGAFKSAFGLGNSGPNSYYRPDPPVPVRVTGSLFWDVDHEDPPYVGPRDFRPPTPWEIHPISGIEFLDD